MIVEGEEETTSHLEGFVAENPDLFRADVFVIADGGNEEVGVPVLEVTTRGGVVLTIEVRTLEQPVHSGVFGGAAPDALMALIHIWPRCTMASVTWRSQVCNGAHGRAQRRPKTSFDGLEGCCPAPGSWGAERCRAGCGRGHRST